MKKIYSAVATVHVLLGEEELREAIQQANLAIIGSEHCNCYNADGKIVPREIDKETEEKLLNTQCRMRCGWNVSVEYDVDENGNIVNIRLKKP
jgi:hypothetical protein